MVAAPLVLPTSFEFTEFKMRVIDTKVTSMFDGRFTESASFGTPYWVLTEARTGYLEPDQIDDAEAFFHQGQRGGQTFICPDAFRQRPRAYGETPLASQGLIKAVGGAAFNGDAVLQTISNSRQITVSGLPNGFVINRGCLIEIRKSTLARSLHRVATAVTSGAGGTAVVVFESPLDIGIFTTAATVHFEKPSCVMMLSEWDTPKAHGARYATFSATEVFFS